MTLTKEDIKEVMKEMGMVTKRDLNRSLNSVKKELLKGMANIAFNSPTSNQFNQLEKRVAKLEVIN